MGPFLVENAYGHGPLAVPVVSANGNVQTGRVLSVRKVLRNPPYTPNTRYPQTHYYDFFFSVRVSNQTYCAAYTTPVLDEIEDLFALSGKDIEVTLKKSKLIARTSKRYKIKAHLVSAKKCIAPSISPREASRPTTFLQHGLPNEAASDLPTETRRGPQPTTPEARRLPKSSVTEGIGADRVVHDSMITGYVSRLAQDIARAAHIQPLPTIEIIDSEEINASVRASHRLYVNRGLILASDNEAELAGVLAHEIAHLNERHHAKIQRNRKIWRVASLCSGPAGLPVEIVGFLFSIKSQRDAERQADWLGLKYENAAGYDPEAFVGFVEKVQATEEQDYTVLAKTLATHPSAKDRIRRAQNEILAELKPQAQYIVDTSEFEQMKLRLAILNHRALEADEEHLALRHADSIGTAVNPNDAGERVVCPQCAELRCIGDDCPRF